MRFKEKLSFIAFQIILRFKSYHQIIKSKLKIKLKITFKSNQTFCLFCFVSEENVNTMNDYIQIMHKSTYLKTNLKKEI